MIPIITNYSNITFSAEDCKDIPGTLIHNEDDYDEIETCWELSVAELNQVKQTGKIYLYTLGRWMPPVMLSAASKIEADFNEIHREEHIHG